MNIVSSMCLSPFPARNNSNTSVGASLQNFPTM